MGGACSTYDEEERLIQGFGGKTRRKETTRETPGLDGRIILSSGVPRGGWGVQHPPPPPHPPTLIPHHDTPTHPFK